MKFGSRLGRLGVLVVALTALSFTTALAASVQLNPSKDNSLFEIGDGSLSNGVGDYLFAGRTAVGTLRRAVLDFDIAGNIPAGSTINSVTLTLNVSKEPLGNLTAHDFFLHRATQDWGEGSSHAAGEEGTGGFAATNDATWLHRFFNTINWASVGGDFFAAASASASVGPGLGLESWSSAQMATDVQGWLDDPPSNFGWFLIGDEGGTFATARRFDSKDLREAGAVPVLEIDFSPPVPSASTWGLLIMTLLFAAAGSLYVRHRVSVAAV